MKRTKNFRKVIASISALLLILTSAVTISASVSPSNVEVIKGQNIDYNSLDGEHGAHYYAYSKLYRKYNKISAEIALPSDRHVNVDNSERGRAAYISFGVGGGAGELGSSKPKGVTFAVDAGLKYDPETRYWHPYFQDMYTGAHDTYSKKYTGTVDMSLETRINSSGETQIVLTIDNDKYYHTPEKEAFAEWRGLIDNQFYRFVSLVPIKAGSDNKNDHTKLVGVGFRHLSIYEYRTNSSSYPYGSPVRKDWVNNDSTVSKAFEVFPDYIGVHLGSYDSEYINIRHTDGAEV